MPTFSTSFIVWFLRNSTENNTKEDKRKQKQRKLYGVFEAISDGGMNIVPHAYVSSGRWFPAQVKFTKIWDCDPLFEDEFYGAIRDNYFSTYKFNFGLSMDQIQSLLWLFKTRKLKIPKSLHFEISGRKRNMDHGISVIAEPELETHSLSSDSCRKSEIMHFDDDAHDWRQPGFHHSVGSEAHSAAGHESHELLTLQEKKGNSDISAKETEDYIPLFSPDHSEPEEKGFDFNEHSGEKQTDFGIFVGGEVSFIPVPQLPLGPILSDEGCNQKIVEPQSASPHGSPCYRLHNSSSAALPLSDASDFQLKDGSSHFKTLLSKGMYSDNSNKRASVFSRLSFSSKDTASKNQNDASGKKLVNDMPMENMEKVTTEKHEFEECYVEKRTSVFLRLTGALDAGALEVRCMTGPKEGTVGWNKRKMEKINFSEWKYYDNVDKSLNQSQEMMASEYDIQEDGFKEDMSVPEILEKLWQRHANLRNMVGKTDFLEQANECHRVYKKRSV